MREMSASAQQTSTLTVPTGVTVSDPVPDAANPATARPAAVTDAQAVAVATDSEPTGAVVPPVVANAAGVARITWRWAITGFALLVVATAVACLIPRFHIKSKVGEDTLVLLSIVALAAGAALVTGGFIRNVLRKL